MFVQTPILQTEGFCINRAGHWVNPLIINGDAIACDAYTHAGCPNGYMCMLNTLDTTHLGIGFCCPAIGNETVF